MKENIYLENLVKTASPAKLVEILYEKFLELVTSSKKDIENNDFLSANEKIKKAQDIITELNISLDLEKGGEIAKNLRALYNYIFKRLIDANVEKNVKILDEVIELVTGLLDAWREAMKKAKDSVKETRKGFDISL
ncbi:MAG TPA: flagellar export chaperone FliS [Thermotoga sp.]|nr:flagellar export chaperone FliS [Thermotoga sp.]